MESPKSPSKGPFDDVLARMAEREEATAKERGFASAADMLRHDQDDRLAMGRLMAEREAHGRRMRFLDQFEGRVTDAMLAELRAKAPSRLTKALEAARSWLDSDKPCLLLCGPPGAGKTIAAIRVMSDSAGARKYAPQFVRAVQLPAAYEPWSSDAGRVDRLDVDVPFLVLDDLGMEPIEDRRSMLAVEEIVDARQSMSRRTIITTNLSSQQIADRYSERIRSRLAQSARVIRLDDVDHRRAK